jgi:hypothetical protein
VAFFCFPDFRRSTYWFVYRMKEPVDQEEAAGIEGAINLPSMEIASTFSVETIDYPNPLGLK